MGITQRLHVLLQNTMNYEARERLNQDYERLVNEEYMGEVFKFMYMGSKAYGDVFPFTNIDSSLAQVYY